jgi:hypothetical protein
MRLDLAKLLPTEAAPEVPAGKGRDSEHQPEEACLKSCLKCIHPELAHVGKGMRSLAQSACANVT